jgi:membrane-associated phospholipid phosphatase
MRLIRLWPPVAVTAMLLLGWAIGKHSTEVDDWFLQYRHSAAQWLLFFTDARVLTIMFAACVAVALYRRRWRLAAVIVVSPPVTIVLVQLLKRLFDRQLDGSLAYPGGHVTVAVVVLGMVVLVASAAVWAVLVAVTAVLLGMVGQAVTYHYFTDTVGGLLLGTAIVCVAALIARPDLTGVNPVRSASQPAVNMRP